MSRRFLVALALLLVFAVPAAAAEGDLAADVTAPRESAFRWEAAVGLGKFALKIQAT